MKGVTATVSGTIAALSPMELPTISLVRGIIEIIRIIKGNDRIILTKKSIEGCIGGIIGAVTIILIYTYIANKFWRMEISYYIIALIGIILSIIGQIGDFAASSIKRYVEIKDFSNMIPGHGGMLDRIDSLIFLAPFAYALLMWI